MKFELDDEQVKKYEIWAKEVALKGVALQKKQLAEQGISPGYTHISCWESGYPYTGAIGGEITFCFSPTSLGVCVVVTDQVTGEEINLTDYGSW